ncbi:MAG TPA: DMT family transporter [Chryseolinea sp.]
MKNTIYIVMVLIGATLYGTMSSFVKLSYSRGYNAAEISFTQAALAALFLGICAFVTRKNNNEQLTRKVLFSLLFTGSLIGLTNFLYYQSVNYSSASLSIVILMQFTWFSLLLEWLIFKKRPSRIELLTVVLILMGTVIAGNIFSTEKYSFSLKGIVLALLSSLTYASYIVANGRVDNGGRWQSKSTLIMIGSACTIFLINSKTIIAGNHFDSEFLLWAIFFAVVGTTIPTALFAVGIPKIGAGVSAILMTVELPVAILCAGLVLNERVSWLQAIGIMIMLAAISTMNYYKLKSEKQK